MQEDIYRIALTLVKGVGPVLGRNLISLFGGVIPLFEESERALLKVSGINASIVSSLKSEKIIERAKRELEFMNKRDVKMLFFSDDNFPIRLSQCSDAPLLLYYKGEDVFSASKMLAIVGTRRLTQYGSSQCSRLINELSVKYPELVIVSGLAYGADICAHRAALNNNLKTVAVYGCGLGQVYPSVHRKEAIALEQKGAVVSEFLNDVGPDRPNFVKRNRIIAGMVDGLIVIESANKGGSLITAHLAHSYNRDVMAFPGRISDDCSAGCNSLIKKNIAALIENANDVEYCMGWEQKVAVQQKIDFKPQVGGDDEKVLYKILMEHRNIDINSISRLSSLPVSKVASVMLNLEFEGVVKSVPGNRYCII